MPNDDAETCTCSALRQAARHVSRQYDEALAPVELGINQFAILARLDRLGPKSIQDLAATLVMDRSTLGHLARPLQARGLLSVQPCDHDRRSRVVALTAAGAQLVTKARPLWAVAQQRFEKAFGALSAVELRNTLKRVEKVEYGDVRSAAFPNDDQAT